MQKEQVEKMLEEYLKYVERCDQQRWRAASPGKHMLDALKEYPDLQERLNTKLKLGS